jgi:hypothetical protein
MQHSFNLVSAGQALQQRWKWVLVFTVLSAVVAGITVFLVPQSFRSSATIVSANPQLADKGRLFNDDIKELYSYFGTGDDLDRIEGIADMDTIYKKLVDEFSLIQYYQPKKDNPSLQRRKSVLYLRGDIHIERTEQDQLKIIAWTHQQQLSADIVNRMVSLITETGNAIWQKNYATTLANLERTIRDRELQYQQLRDSIGVLNDSGDELAAARIQVLLDQIKLYRKYADEFTLAASDAPPVLYVLEHATPAAKAERPDKLAIILAACLLGFVFSSLIVLVTDRKPAA